MTIITFQQKQDSGQWKMDSRHQTKDYFEFLFGAYSYQNKSGSEYVQNDYYTILDS